MSDNKKKTNSGKTINFAERKKELSQKQEKQSTSKDSYNDNRVIQYDINKMRDQINQHAKHKNKRISKLNFNSPLWVKIFYSIILISIVILTAGKITNNFGTMTSEGFPKKFETQSTSISQKEREKYIRVIEHGLNEKIESDKSLNVHVKDIHKNKNYIIASGYFVYPKEKDKIYFDSTIINDELSSIVVNGYELVNNKNPR